MGLFDGAFFDPQTYGGQGIPGWLSSLLQNPQLQQSLAPSQGLGGAGIDVSARSRSPEMGGGLLPSIPSQNDREGMAGYSPMAMPQPGGAPMQPQMQQPPMMGAPQQQQMQQQIQPPQPQQSAGGNLGAGIMGFLGSLGQDSFGGAIQNAAEGFSTGHSPGNRTVEALVARGLDRNTALAAARNPTLLAAVIPQLFGTKSGVNINGRLVDPTSGRLIADYSDTAKPVPLGHDQRLVNPNTGQEIAGVSDTRGKPPAGYEWAKDGNGLSPIANGPATHIPAGEAGRLAMIDAAMPGLQEAKKVLLKDRGALGDGIGSSVGYTLNAGDSGRAKRGVRIAIEAALRTATGAAAPEAEVQRYLDMYMPMPGDSVETATQKFGALEHFMNSTKETALQGRVPATAGGWKEISPGVRIREKK